MININSLALPACSGTNVQPELHKNLEFKKRFANLQQPLLLELKKKLQLLIEAREKTFSQQLLNQVYLIECLPLIDNQYLFVFREQSDTVALHKESKFWGYREDSTVAGFTLNGNSRIMSMNASAKCIMTTFKAESHNGSLAFLLEENTLSTAEEIGSELTFSTKLNYRYYTIRVRTSVVPNEYIVRVEDITDMAAVSTLMKQHLRPYDNLLKSLRIGFYQSTPSGKFLMVNKEMARILGYDSNEQMLSEISEAKHLYVEDQRREQVLKHLKTSGQIVDSETELYRRDGTTVQVSGTIVAIKNQADEIVLIQGTMLDISAESKKERILKLLKNTLYNVNDSINIANLDDEIIFVNRSFTELYGYEPEEVLGKKSDIFGGGKTSLEAVRQNTIDEGGHRFEVVNFDKYGNEIIIALSTSVVRDELDNPIAFIAIARDITKNRESERALMDAKHRAEEASQLKSVILSNMSHELRTPLTGIIGFASILLEQLADADDNDTLYFLDNIKKAGERLLQTMNNILLLAELESRSVDFKFSETNLCYLLEQCCSYYHDEAEKSGLELSLDCVGKVYALTDNNLLIQILNPLIDNAIKFTEHGKVVLSAGKYDDNRVYVSVQDTGIGINEASLNKIFEPFTQLSAGIKRKYQGTGLGLHICKRYVDMLDGELVVKSEPDQGSLFKVILPAK